MATGTCFSAEYERCSRGADAHGWQRLLGDTLADDIDITGHAATHDTAVFVGHSPGEHNGILTTLQLDDGNSDTTHELHRRPTGSPALVDSIAVIPVLGDYTKPSSDA